MDAHDTGRKRRRESDQDFQRKLVTLHGPSIQPLHSYSIWLRILVAVCSHSVQSLCMVAPYGQSSRSIFIATLNGRYIQSLCIVTLYGRSIRSIYMATLNGRYIQSLYLSGRWDRVNSVGFRWWSSLLPYLCPMSVP